MPPQRLPIVNSDDGVWGDIIRQYLMKEHYNDDTDNVVNGGHQKITIRPGTATAGTAPLKFTSGTLLSTPEAGAIEFNTDSLYLTQTTSATRKKVAVYNDASGATGDIYYRDSSGYFTRLGAGSTDDILTIASGIPSWTAAIVGKALNNTNTVTLKDVSFTLQSDGDITKQAQFDLSDITTGTTRTYTLPDASSTLLDTETDQIINGVKEYTSMLYTREIWVTPTSGPGSTAAITLDNESGQIWQNTNNSSGSWALWDQTNSKAPILVQANSHDQMLVIDQNGVYVDDSYFTIVNLADPTKQGRFQLSGNTTGTTRTYTLPDADTAIVGTAVAQTLTNKTIAFTSNVITGVPYDLSIMAFGSVTTRAAGAGDFAIGMKLQRACTLTSVTYRASTADASGDLVVELRKNGSAVSGSSATIAAANQLTGGTSTGTWSFAAGDILTVYITAVGTTPGKGLVADIAGVTA